MKTKSPTLQDDSSSSGDERDVIPEEQRRHQPTPRPRPRSPPPQIDSSSSDEEEQHRCTDQQREKTKGNARHETDTGQTVRARHEPKTGQTVHASRRKKMGSVMQVETDMGQTVYARHEPETGQTAPMRHETDTGQIASTSGRQQTRSTTRIESRDPQSYPTQTAYLPTGSNVQIEPTDAQVHPGQTAHLPTGNNMQLESADHRSCSTRTACAPPDAVAQQKTDNGRQEKRLRSPPDAAVYPTASDNARPTSGRVSRQPEEDKIAVEEEFSSLQLIPEADLQSPAVARQQQECRVVTQAVIEPEPRGRSSTPENSD